MTKSSLQAVGVSVSRGDHRVVHHVDLEVARGEVVAVVGPSGSGKSSLLYGLAGLIPIEGVVHHRGRVGVVFQDHGVFPWLTVEKNVRFGLADLSANDRDARVEAALATCGISDVAGRYPAEISGGQRQRVAVARTLATHPDIMLLDEPFANVDVVTRVQLRAWLRDLVTELGLSVVLVTHDLDDAIATAVRVIALVGGRVRIVVDSVGMGDADRSSTVGTAGENIRTRLLAAMLE